MASTTFTNYQTPAIDASWLNDVNQVVYTALGNNQTAAGVLNFLHAIKSANNSIADIDAGTLANRPAAGTANRIYISTTSPITIYFDNGTSWVSLAFDQSNVTITGGSITGITDLAIADGGTGASTAANARTNLGLGTLATQSSSNVSITGGNITGGSITGITDLAIADGGTGASTASAARTNLGLGTLATQNTGAVPSLTMAGAINFAGYALENYTERAAPQVVNNSGTYTIDFDQGRFFPVLLSSNATIAFTNVPTTGIVSFTLEIAQNSTGGYSITWPTSTTFFGGTAPTPSSAANAVDTYVGYSPDQGTTWRIERSAKGWA